MKQPISSPKVAIITRTKDRDLFLERAIQSVEKQTYKDYIHVIFNDGGDKEKIDELISKYGSKNRIAIHSPKSLGLIQALNKAIESSKSKYIAILDDDDSWHPERLEKTIAYLEEMDAKAVVVKMDIIVEEIKDGVITKISQYLHPESGEGEISLYKQCFKNYVSNGVVTYHRSVYEELGGYDESLETAEDWDFGVRLLMKYDIEFLRDEPPLFFYHQRPNQEGVEGNSGLARVRLQEKTINILRNRYLREDLKHGRFGVGYIMNSLVLDELATIRLERHINYVADGLKADIKEEIEKPRGFHRKFKLHG